MLTEQDIDDAVQKLDDGFELLIVRGSRAKWRVRRGITFSVPIEKARSLFDELKSRYRVRTGITPPRRILTPEPTPSEDHPSCEDRDVLARKWETVRDLARLVDISTSGIRDAIDRDSIHAVKREGTAADGRRAQLLHVRVDEALAGYLAGLGYTGTLITHDGRELAVQDYRPVVHLHREQYTREELAEKLDCTRHTVSKHLRNKQLPHETKAKGLHVYDTCEALATVIEREWTVEVILEETAT